jgi:SET domain-containing protein
LINNKHTKDLEIESKIFVKESEIHGNGLFTSADITEGTIIMIISGEVICAEECIRREIEENNVYIFWINDDCYIDTSGTDKIKYINHNCDFNCDIIERDETSLYLVAYRDIKRGEELTIDYGYDEIYESCNCDKCLYSKAV